MSEEKKAKRETEYPECCYYKFTDRAPCEAAEKTVGGVYKCLALNDTDFGDRACPFYKEREDE